jgi:acetyl-CoA C-acetyltransferase
MEDRMSDDRQPIIVGTAQATWRERDTARTPVDALEEVARGALASAGTDLAATIDAMVQVPFIMNQVPSLAPAMPRNVGGAVARRLGIDAAVYTADVGGNLPQQLVAEFAARLFRGEARAVLLGGVELLSTFLGAVRGGEGFPDWACGEDREPECIATTPTMTAPTEQAHGLFEPIRAYPLFEAALRHAHGRDRGSHARVLGSLISRMSEVAARHPQAWRREALSAEAVLSTDGGNRMICDPYTKVMNSLIAVDQSAAVILTTVGHARALGIDPERWVYLRGAASAHDSWFLSQRARLYESPALRGAVTHALQRAGLELAEIDCFDLYSCFPSAIQVAADAIGLGLDDPRGLTLTGGMSLFGGPGNNYSLHAIATLVDHLRDGHANTGLISANGGYLTKHAVGVYARHPAPGGWQPGDDAALQQGLDATVLPDLAEEGRGSFTVIAHTVSFDREGPKEGILLGELDNGARCVAVARDAATIDLLLAQDCVGHVGAVAQREGLNHACF